VADFCEQDNEPSVSIKEDEFLNELSVYELLMKVPLPCSTVYTSLYYTINLVC
jgi:hypothetical protein